VTTYEKLRLQNNNWKATLLCGSQPWDKKKRITQEIEVKQVRFLGPI
jgi:hypothetical protein